MNKWQTILAAAISIGAFSYLIKMDAKIGLFALGMAIVSAFGIAFLAKMLGHL